MALVGEKLASDAMLDKVLCVFSGHRPIETCTEGLAYKGPSMNFSQELPPFFPGDTSLKYSGRALIVEFSLMNLVGFRVSHNAARLILILREFLPIKVGQKGSGPWGNNCHDEMGRQCNFSG